MEKIYIQNRKQQNISLLYDIAPEARGLVFIAHGLGGNKDQPLIHTFAASFREKGYTTIMYDAINTFGESDGNYADATVTNYYEDLEDVIDWAGTQTFFQEPFVLVGHSLGGICTALYAETYPNRVKGLAPISTVISGKLSLQSPNKVNKIEEWKRTGWIIKKSSRKPGLIKRLKWSHMEDRMQYDLLDGVDVLTMPALMIVGEFDESTPPEHQQILFDHLPAKKELHIIEGAPHTFKSEQDLLHIQTIFSNWIDDL